MSFFDIEFENQESKSIITNLVELISNYDIYDFISRVAGLNLLSKNQNKTVLTDTLLQYVLSAPYEKYRSTFKMSDKKFRLVANELSETFLAASIDPCENVFIQNVIFNGSNYKVYNGIDVTPAYNLQALIRVLFEYENQFDSEYLEKVHCLFSLVLGISDTIIRQTGDELENTQYDESKSLIVPSGDVVRRNAGLVNIPLHRFEKCIQGIFPLNEVLIDFGVDKTGDISNRPFYIRPFLKDDRNKSVIILNTSLLPTFAFFKALEWAEQYRTKEFLINKYNDYLWLVCRKTLDIMGHKKIKESVYGLNCISNNYYKESILTVYNNQLLFLFYICDDGEQYSGTELHNEYPDTRHSNILQERLKYYQDNLNRLDINNKDTYFLIILNSIGRPIKIEYKENPFGYDPIIINPFELHCIRINERENKAFLPRYIRAKSQLNTAGVPYLFSELNAICLYTSNNYSFYMSDDIDPNSMRVLIAPGDSLSYITEALIKENRILIDSYDEKKTEVVLLDKLRNIYVEDQLYQAKHMAFCIIYNNVRIWLKSDELIDYKQINIYYSLLDTVSYWLSECKPLIESYTFPFLFYTIHFSLTGNVEEFYYERKGILPFETCIGLSIEKNHIFLNISPEAYSNFNQVYNDQEKEFCRFILAVFDDLSIDNKDYTNIIDVVFRNPLKKKFFSFDYESRPYLKPLLIENHRSIHIEDEDYLSGIVGKALLNSDNWNIGIVDDSQRCKVANEVVTWLYNRLEEMASLFEPDHIIEVIYQDLEETIYKLMLVRKRFYSDIACYPEKETTLLEDYNSLNKTSLALKFLIEYITARPSFGTEHFGIGQYEELLAICSMLIDWAYKSDLFYYNIVNTPIEFLKSKRIGMKHDEFIDMYQYSDICRSKQLKYDSSYLIRKQYNMGNSGYEEALEKAFYSEFGYSYSTFIHVVFSMVLLNKEEIISISRSEMIEELVLLDAKLSKEEIHKVLDDIVYTPREDFLKLPSGFDKEDAYPWRFNRRYSFNRRPVLQRGETLIWGNRQLYHMLEYVTDLIYTGKFRAKSKDMKTLCGLIAKEQGEAFNKQIVEMVQDMRVFTVYSNVKKVNGKRIAENGNDLGDIDILIIDRDLRKIVAAEVKNFRFSRNPREINQEFISMFIDEDKPCFVTKHNRRIEWLRAHITDVKQAYELEDVQWGISGIFITSQALISQYIYKQSIKCITKAELCVEAIRNA